MGAWDVGNFENDSALDWMHDFLETDDKMHLLQNTLKYAMGRQGIFGIFFRRGQELEEPEACAVLVAGEIIALILGSPAKELPEELKDWGNKNQLKIEKKIVNDALNAIQNVRENSELKLLWEETDDYQNWLEEVFNLEDRLKS